MTFREGADFGGRRATSGGSGRGGTIAAGGGIGTIIIVGLYLLLGGDPSDIGSILGSQETSQNQNQLPGGSDDGALEHCKTAADANEFADCRVEGTARSIDAVWTDLLPQQANIEYTKPGLVIFQDSVRTGCGAASSATGPFYCPSDQTAYFDVSFFDQLDKLGGSDAPLAQMYTVAHEFGHHIQQLEGNLGLSNYNQPGEDSNAVKVELQADCYAGLWASRADKGDNAFLEPITEQQIADAVETARAVGDDNIQKRSGGGVRPDTWTHGSSEQRQKAFLAGYKQGTMGACDTLGRGNYNS